MTPSVPAVSVVVPTYQRRTALSRLLETLRSQSLAPDLFEVVVVIDGSTDGTAELVANLRAPYGITVIIQANAGRAAACNAGIGAARGELVVLLDDDMEPSPELLSEHLRAHEASQRLAILGAVPIRTDGDSAPVTRFVAAKFAAHLARLGSGSTIGHRSFYSGNLSIRRDILLEVGLFDPSYREYGNEDTELALRLIEAGVALHYSSDALAHQHYEKNLAALARDSLAKGGTAVLTARKHSCGTARPDLESFRGASPKWTDRSAKWRALRGAFIAASRFSEVPQRVLVRVVEASARWKPARADVRYLFLVDCFYWLGVTKAFGPAPAKRGMLAARPLDSRSVTGGA